MTSLLVHFRSREVTWRNFLSRDGHLQRVCFVGAKRYPKVDLYVFYSHFQVNSNQMTSLPVTWGHVTSFSVTWQSPTASYSPVRAQSTQNSTYRPSTAISMWLPVKWRYFRVAGHVRSPDISCHVTVACELQPCRCSNVTKTRHTHFLQPIPGDFRSNDVTSRHFPSREVTWRHFLYVIATSCELQPCRSSNAAKTQLMRLLQPLPGDFVSNDVTSVSFPVMWGHMTSFPVTWRPPSASFSPEELKRTQNLNYTPSTATSRWLPMKWRHFRSCEVTWRHFLLCDGRLLRVRVPWELKRTQN